MAPTSTTALPITEEDVESVILQSLGSHCKILSYEVEPFSKSKTGFLGTHLSLNVKVQKKSQNELDIVKTQKFFVKIQSDSPIIQEIMMDENIFLEEVNFYTKIYPLMIENYEGVKWSPRCFLAKDDVLIFEDLRIQGYNLRQDPLLDESALRSALKVLARFHALSIIVEAQLGKTLKEAFPGAFSEKFYSKYNKFGQSTVVGYDTIVLMAEKYNLDSSLVPKIYEKVCNSVKAQEGECNVVCHGDLWKNNLLFNDSEQKCILVDFQMLRYASLASDIGILLYLHTTPETRKKLEPSLLKHYYSALYDTLVQTKIPNVKIPKYESIVKEFNEHRLVGMSYALLFMPGIYLFPEDLAQIMNDPVKLEEWFYENRIDTIKKNMEENPAYDKLMKDIVIEFLEEASRVFQQ